MRFNLQQAGGVLVEDLRGTVLRQVEPVDFKGCMAAFEAWRGLDPRRGDELDVGADEIGSRVDVTVSGGRAAEGEG